MSFQERKYLESKPLTPQEKEKYIAMMRSLLDEAGMDLNKFLSASDNGALNDFNARLDELKEKVKKLIGAE